MTDFRQLCLRMADELDHYRQLLTDDRCAVHLLAAEARAALAAPTPPANGEVGELVTLLAVGSHCAAGARLSPEQCRRAAALLREARPQPVPVAERPWEQSGWSDAEGRCWIRYKLPTSDWRLMDPINTNVPQIRNAFDFVLPHWAIPTPTETTNG